MFIVISLPEAFVESWPPQKFNSADVLVGGNGLKGSDRVPQRRGRPCACPFLGTHKGCPYIRGAHELVAPGLGVRDMNDSVEMIGHDNMLVQFHGWESCRNLEPRSLHHAAGVIETHDAIGDLAQQAPAVLNANCYIVGPRR